MIATLVLAARCQLIHRRLLSLSVLPADAKSSAILLQVPATNHLTNLPIADTLDAIETQYQLDVESRVNFETQPAASLLASRATLGICTGALPDSSLSVVGCSTRGQMAMHTRSVSVRDIRDGTSNTLMVGEGDYGLLNYKFRRGPCAGEVRGGFVTWGLGYPGATIGATTGVFNADRLVTGFNEFFTFRSDHSSGANFLFADGSVRYVVETVNAAVLDAAATCNGKETGTDVLE